LITKGIHLIGLNVYISTTKKEATIEIGTKKEFITAKKECISLGNIIDKLNGNKKGL
jgi:hypothetical protein